MLLTHACMHMGTRVCMCVYVCMVYVCMCVWCMCVPVVSLDVCTHLCSLFGSREHGLLHIRGLPDSRKVSVGGPPTLFELGDRDPTSTRQIPHSD